MCLGLANGYIEPKEINAGEVVNTLQQILKTGDQPVGDRFFVNITSKTVKDSLDLINRQQFQLDNYSHNVRTMAKDFLKTQEIISQQQAEIEWKTTYMHSLQVSMEEIKAETIKELEAKIYEKLHEAEMHGNFEPTLTREMLDSIFKEMVGDDK